MIRTVHANGIDIRCDIQGQGPWVTLSHSLACDLSMWDEQVEVLAKHHTVLRYDTRGHGGTSASESPYSFDMALKDLLGLLNVLNVERTHFVGLSMGGMIAQHFALALPERLDRLVLASTSCRTVPGTAATIQGRIAIAQERGMEALVQPTLARWFTEPYRYENTGVMERIGGLIRSTPVSGYAGCARMVSTLDTADRLSNISTPTLVLVGDQDAGTTPEIAESIAAAIPDSRLEILPQASHLLNIEQAQLFNLMLLEFLR